MAIVEARLTVLELCEDDDDKDILRLSELRTGELLPDNAHLIIGRVQEYRRRYRAPETAEGRALDRALTTAQAKAAAKKGSRGADAFALDREYRLALAAERTAEVGGAR